MYRPSISVMWMSQLPAPQAILELLSWCKTGCKTGCTSGRCSCFKNNIKCTNACNCKECSNYDQTQGDMNDKGYDSDADSANDTDTDDDL